MEFSHDEIYRFYSQVRTTRDDPVVLSFTNKLRDVTKTQTENVFVYFLPSYLK